MGIINESRGNSTMTMLKNTRKLTIQLQKPSERISEDDVTTNLIETNRTSRIIKCNGEVNCCTKLGQKPNKRIRWNNIMYSPSTQFPYLTLYFFQSSFFCQTSFNQNYPDKAFFSSFVTNFDSVLSWPLRERRNQREITRSLRRKTIEDNRHTHWPVEEQIA